MRRRDGDSGFTLVEIVISIAILALLMLPALNSYITAAKVNQQSQISQKAATLGQNVAEKLKTMDLEDIMLQFNSSGCFRIVNSNLNGCSNTYVMNSYTENGYREIVPGALGYLSVLPGDIDSSITVSGSPPVYRFQPPVGRSCYYMGINKIKDGTAQFDVLITLDASNYRDSLRYPDSMNNYRMPELNDLEQKEVILMDLEGMTTSWSDLSEGATYDNSNSSDQQALEYFKNLQSTYLIYLDSLRETGVTPTPIPATEYTEPEIHDAISKDIQVSITKDSIQDTLIINCSLEYRCSLDLNNDGLSETTVMNLYGDNGSITGSYGYDKLVYLFYTPSDFIQADTISLSNDGAKIKLMLAKQEGASVSDLIINNAELNTAVTDIVTNLSAGNIATPSLGNISGYNLITKEAAKDRIFDVTVEVHPVGSLASNQLSEPYAVYRTTKENE